MGTCVTARPVEWQKYGFYKVITFEDNSKYNDMSVKGAL